MDSSLFNLNHLLTHTKTLEQLICNFLFADDAARVAHTKPAMQQVVTCFAKAAQQFGLEVSQMKTEVLYLPPPNELCHPPYSNIYKAELKAVNQFTYLISSDAHIDNEINNRLVKANSTLKRHTYTKSNQTKS